MGLSTPKQKANWKQSGGGIKSGDAPHPGSGSGRGMDSSLGHVHDAGFGYATFAKSSPPCFGQGSGQAGVGLAVKSPNPMNKAIKKRPKY